MGSTTAILEIAHLPLTTVLDLGNQTSGSRITTPPLWIKSRKALLIGLVFVAVVGIVALSSSALYRRDAVTPSLYPVAQRQARSLRPTGEVIAMRADLRQSASNGTRLFDSPIFELASQFLRTWRISGPEVCAAFRNAGIETTQWRAASMRSVNYECYFQRVYERDEARPLRSTFLRVRGNSRGDIFEISGRIVGPKTDDRGMLDPSLMRIFEVIVVEARWEDFQEALPSIQKLLDVRSERFGAYFDFTREPSQENSYNFALVLSQDSDQQARTRAYFSETRWLANPYHRQRVGVDAEEPGSFVPTGSSMGGYGARGVVRRGYRSEPPL
ncbi:DUF6030 family protein [Rhizobium grahamii]|uniref:Exopolysaccharide synthesis protein n=1 Tax=Rhizobium grahamii CCGE 502 TaxID=990285 RepID=S3HCT1_9HYPH|nr:DUF6030 family protein [Rhizobium grahamii]EPE96542.1 hypothetical protein RGCCGE502_19280 [Rhizobium grahamii CCGE 502]